MIEEVKDFFGDVKSGLGSKGFVIFIAAAGLFGLYHLLKKDDSEEVLYTPTGVSGYPSLDKNADVVIDSINNTIEGSLSDILNSMQSSESTILGGISDSESNILGGIGDAAGNISDSLTDVESNITGAVTDAKEEIKDGITEAKDEVNGNLETGFETVGNYVQEGLDKMSDLSSKIDNIDTTPRVEYVPVYGGGDTITNNTVNVSDSVVGSIVNGSTVENVIGNVNIAEPTKVDPIAEKMIEEAYEVKNSATGEVIKENGVYKKPIVTGGGSSVLNVSNTISKDTIYNEAKKYVDNQLNSTPVKKQTTGGGSSTTNIITKKPSANKDMVTLQ